MTPNFDITQSLRLAPPRAPNGVTWKERVVLDIENDIVVDDKNQARHKNCNADHVCDIHDSFVENGWIYTEQPPWGTWDPVLKKFVLKDGFHRVHGGKKSGWEKIIVDIFSPDSDLDEILFQLKSNENHTPKKGSDAGDIINAALTAIQSKHLADDDQSIRLFIKKAASHLSKNRREEIYVKIKNSSPDNKFRTYLSKGVGRNNITAACKHEFKIPYGGDANYSDTQAFGYVTTEKTGRMTLMNAIKLIAEKQEDMKRGLFNVNKIPDVHIFAYIEAPGHNKSLREQREEWMNSFNKTLESLKKFCEYQTGSSLKEDFPIKFSGFLPQLIDKDPNKGGNPVETTIVDVNHIPVNWKSNP